MKKLLVLFSGSGTNLENLINTLHLTKKVDIVHTITNNPNAKGIDICKSKNIPCTIISSKDLSKEQYENRLIENIASLEYDLIVLSGYMKIVSPVFLQTAKTEVINIHPSLLPRHKGLKAIERSYEDENIDGGVTVHFVNEKMDDGEIIIQKRILKESLSFDKYLEEVKKAEFEIFPKAVLQTLELE